MAAEKRYKIEYLHERLVRSKGPEHNFLFLVGEVERQLERMTNNFTHSKAITKGIYNALADHRQIFLEAIQLSFLSYTVHYYKEQVDKRVYKEIRLIANHYKSPYLHDDLQELYYILDDYYKNQKQKRNYLPNIYKERKLPQNDITNTTSNYNPHDFTVNQEISKMKLELDQSKGKELYREIMYKGYSMKELLSKEIVECIEKEKEDSKEELEELLKLLSKI